MSESHIPMFDENEPMPNQHGQTNMQPALHLAQLGRDQLQSALSRVYGLLVDIQVLTFVNHDSQAQALMASDPTFAISQTINDRHRAMNIERYRITIDEALNNLKTIVDELQSREASNKHLIRADHSDETRALIAERDRLRQQVDVNKQDMSELLTLCKSLQSQLVLLDVDNDDDDDTFD